jgi:hypothetical protein
MGLQLARYAVGLVADRQLGSERPLFRLGNGRGAHAPEFSARRLRKHFGELFEEVSALLMLHFPSVDLFFLAILAKRSNLGSHHSKLGLSHGDIDVAFCIFQGFFGSGSG